MKKNRLSLVVMLCMLCLPGMITASKYETGTPADWNDVETPAGKGTAKKPWLITSTEQFQEIANDVLQGNSFAGQHFALTNDIEASWIPVGTLDTPFRGSIDGRGHKISVTEDILWNRYAGRCALIGVFGCVGEGSEISNLKINCHKSILSKDGFTQMDYTFAGGLAAIVLPGATVKNCTVDARLVFDGKKYTFAGNAIGLNLGTIDNVVSASKVLPVQKNKNADSHIGLITGYCGKGSEVLSYGSYEGMIPSGVDLADGEWISVELYISSDDAFFRKYVEMPDENGDYAFRHVALFQDEMISYVKTLIHKNDNSTEILSTREIAFMPDNNVLNTKSGNYVTQVY